MKLRYEQLSGALKHRLAPIYLIHGDEPLQAMEAADAVRAAARDAGYDEREVLAVDSGFDWRQLAATAASGSLFASRRLLELRLDDAKPGDAGSRALTAYAARPADETVLLVLCGKLDGNAQKSRWFAALERAGIAVLVWPLEGRQLAAWIEQRMRGHGLSPGSGVAALLAEQTEGNLLAAAQEIDKLALLYGSGPIDADRLRDVISDSARFNVFGLADAALAGHGARVVRVVEHLRQEASEPALAAWALAREVQLLDQLHQQIAQGQTATSAMTRLRVWDKRRPLLQRALERLRAADCRRLLAACGELDRTIKGLAPGRPWDELQRLALDLAGQRIAASTSAEV